MQQRFFVYVEGSIPRIYRIPVSHTARLLNELADRNPEVFDSLAAAKEAALTIINQRPKRKSLAITKSSFLPSTENEDLRRTIDDLTEDDVERFRF